MNDIAIKVENLTKVYKLYDKPVDRLKESLHPFRKCYHRDFYALKDVSFEVKKGETLGIIGKNGSGKSTLLKIITGVLTPTSGNVYVNGKISALLELGAGFNPEFTGIENVYFQGMLMEYTKEEMDAKLPEILAFADIGDFVNQPVKTYSSGMFVRLAFAVAISVDPEILIVDEALAVGDISFQAKCYKKFEEFRNAKKTIVFVTHSLDTVIRYCNWAFVLNNGIMEFEGNPKDAVDYYKRILTLDGSSSVREEKVVNYNSLEMKTNFNLNKSSLSYGNLEAEIVDFGIFDKDNYPVQKLFHGEPFYVKMVVKFNTEVENPIFAFTIKDLKGLELVGTNTHYEKVYTGKFFMGDRVIVEFKQILNLQSGAYALSLGCTNFDVNGFLVYHRLYDIILFEVISHKNFVGFFDPESEVLIEKI
ncbi:MAG: ABC transporter ATP-binding protein [Brevinematia bacterium]